jgi:MFS family permease
MVPAVMVLLLGVAVCQPPLSALVIDLVPKEVRGNAAGFYNTLTVFGNAIGALIGGLFIQLYGLLSMFALSGGLVTVGLIIGFIYLPKGKPRREGEEILSTVVDTKSSSSQI